MPAAAASYATFSVRDAASGKPLCKTAIRGKSFKDRSVPSISIQAEKPALDVVPCSPAGEYEQHRIDRLRELRAVIEALRHEQESRDPLLAWVLKGNRPHTN
jgi:hypothetical protein